MKVTAYWILFGCFIIMCFLNFRSQNMVNESISLTNKCLDLIEKPSVIYLQDWRMGIDPSSATGQALTVNLKDTK